MGFEVSRRRYRVRATGKDRRGFRVSHKGLVTVEGTTEREIQDRLNFLLERTFPGLRVTTKEDRRSSYFSSHHPW